MSRRRRPRSPQPEAPKTPEDPMGTIREQADEYTPAPISDEEIDAEAQATESAEHEIAAGMDELSDDRHERDTDESEDAPSQDPDLVDGPEEEWEPKGEVENFVDTFPNPVEQEPEFDPEIFERGPLAAGIRMLTALLVEAEAGYINAQVDELGRILDERLTPDERLFLGRVASELRTASDLPDVAGAYKHLVRARVQAGA
jgi:hypothetical protein